GEVRGNDLPGACHEGGGPEQPREHQQQTRHVLWPRSDANRGGTDRTTTLPTNSPETSRANCRPKVLSCPLSGLSPTLDGDGATRSRNHRESRQTGDFCLSWPSLMSGSRETLLSPRPLRTVRETFASYGSSLH